MNLNDLNDGTANTKIWLNPICNNLTCNILTANTEIDVQTINATTIEAITSQTDTLLLNQQALVGVPPPNYCLIYADNTDRINVASQSQPTQQIAYLSDIPIVPAPSQDNNIVSSDGLAEVRCDNSGIIRGFIGLIDVLNFDANKLSLAQGQSTLQLPTVSDGLSQATTAYFGCDNMVDKSAFAVTPDALILSRNNILRAYVGDNIELKDANNTERLVIQTGSGYTSLRSGNGIADRFDIDGLGAYMSVGGQVVFYANPTNSDTRLFSPDGSSVIGVENSNGVRICSAYLLPKIDGSNGQYLTSNGAGVSSWTSPIAPPVPQMYGLYSQTSTQTVANTTTETTLIGAGVGSLTVPALFFQDGYSFLYKTGGLFRDSSNGQTIRFRLRNGGVLFDSGVLVLSNVNTNRGWNIEAQFTYYGGNIVTNFMFSYTDGVNNTSGFTNQGTNAINNAVPNTLNFTAQWGTASAQNTISSNYGTLNKIF